MEELLKDIKAMERKAEEQIALAEKEKERLVQKGKTESIKSYDEKIALIEKKRDELIKKKQEEIEKKQKEILEKGKKQISSMRKAVKFREKKAVDLVIQRFEEGMNAQAN